MSFGKGGKGKLGPSTKVEEHGGMTVPEWLVTGYKVRLSRRIASVEDVVNVIRGT